MAIDQDVFTLLDNLVDVSVQQGLIDSETGYNRVWFQRSGVRNELFNSHEQSMIETDFDIECISDSIDEAQTLAASVFTLNGYTTKFGNTYPLAVWVTDQTDDYVAKNQWANDRGLHVAVCKLTVQS